MEPFWINLLCNGVVVGLLLYFIRLTFTRILAQIDAQDEKIGAVDTRLTIIETQHQMLHGKE
jgi:hypothetical protein